MALEPTFLVTVWQVSVNFMRVPDPERCLNPGARHNNCKTVAIYKQIEFIITGKLKLVDEVMEDLVVEQRHHHLRDGVSNRLGRFLS